MIINQNNEHGDNIVNDEKIKPQSLMKKLRQWLCEHDFYTTNKEFALFHCRKCGKLAADYFNEEIDIHIKALFFGLKISFWSIVLCGTMYYLFWLIGGA